MSRVASEIRVLHVDDEPDFADLAATFLEREDERFEVETAISASAGLDQMETSTFDCIVSDHDMPGQNGIEFLEAVREAYPDLPFILYTGKGSEEVASEAISTGVTDYLQKESGTSQYTVLANRIRNAVDNYHAQDELAEREKRLKLFFEQSPLGVIEWDANFDFVRLNDTAEEILGYAEDELVGRSWEVIVPESDRAPVDEVVSNLLDNTSGYRSVNKNVRKGGERIVCEWHNRVVTDDNGEVVAIFSQFQNITEENERKVELRFVHDLLDQSERIADVGGWEIDMETDEVFWTDHLFDMLGVEHEDAPSLEEALDVYLEEDRPRVVSAIEDAVATGESFDVQARFERPDGEIRWFRIQGEPVLEAGDVVTLRGAVQDITDHKKREERLKQTTARLEVLFESSPDMIDIHTTDGTIVDVNQQFCETFNQPKDELVGQKVWEIDQEIDPEELQDMWEGMDVGDRTAIETEFETNDGTRFPVEVHLTRLPVEDGDRFMVISRDITERKQRMEEIETLKERLELAVEGANLGVWDWDMTTDEVEFNDQWAEMLGYTLDELEPHLRAWETRVHPDDLDEVKAALDAHIDQQTEYYDTEHRMRTADGEWKWIRDLGKIVERDEAGEPIRAVGIHLYIDESKQYQQELEQKTGELEELTTRLEEQYQTLFEEAPVMAVVTRTENGQPIIEDCNNQFAETLNFETETLIGTELAEFYTPDSREALIEGGAYKRSLKGEFTRKPRELMAADGEIVETVLRAVPRKDAAGEVVGNLSMYIDITEREEVKRANERLEEFTSIVSHDLRNPLNVASGRLELARDDCESPHLETVERAHGRMETLIEELLTLARDGEGVTDTKAVDLTAVVAECWETVETAEASLKLESDQTIVADGPRLKQLFENLIRNAVEHGGSAVTVTVGELEDGFYIEDTGPGIPENDAETVFEVGYSTNVEGIGFGLSIVQQIVEAHDWAIRVTGRSEGGARFEITGVEFTAE